MGEETTAVVTAETRELTTMENPPAAVLAEAQRAAVALKDVIARKPRPVMMGGEQYLEFEDWQTLGRFYAVTAKEDGDPEFVNLDGVKGFKASAVALLNGQVVSRATAYCLNDEEKWSTRTKYEYQMVLKDGGHAREEESDKKDWVWEPNPNKPGGKRPKRVRIAVGEEAVPLFQLSSMAQTRACAKALRNVLSWVAVLAGYKPTPAEEMESLGAKATEKPTAEPTKAAQQREPGKDDGPAPPSESESCPFCGSVDYILSKDGKSAVCAQKECSRGWNLGR